MWTCSNCRRIFEKAKQPHSCRKIPLELHFKNKSEAKGLFDILVDQIDSKVGKCQIVSIPCCIHLFGKYDFLAILPKRDRLEIRFALDRKIDSPRLVQSVPLSSRYTKNCIDVKNREEIDEELIKWLRQAYFLKDKD